MTSPTQPVCRAVRLVHIMQMLDSRPYTVDELAAICGVGRRAIKRDLRAIASLPPMPVITVTENLYEMARQQKERRAKSRRWLVLRLEILERDGYTCCYCGAAATDVDHIVPRSKGGEDKSANLCAACGACNSAKRDRPAEWLFNRLAAAKAPIP